LTRGNPPGPGGPAPDGLKEPVSGGSADPWTEQKSKFADRSTTPSVEKTPCSSYPHLVDHLLPRVPSRQWVFTFPIPVRLALSGRPHLVTAAWQACRRVLFSWQRRRLRRGGVEAPSCGAITFVQRHTLTFDGGDVVLDLPIGDSFTSTEPAMFVRAAGTLDGVEFVIEDYFDFLYNPEHHYFRRDFLVFFAAPIGEACGLMVTELDPFAPEALQVVSLVDCAGAAVSTRAVSAAVVERVPGSGWQTSMASSVGSPAAV
jgi:hypothetical protein